MFFSKIGLTITVLTFSSLLTLISNLAKANNIFGNYNPPTTKEVDQTRISGSGSRGLCQNPIPKDSLILLIPEEEIAHQTISSNPSFYFYAKTAPTVPLKFNLIIPEPNANNPITKKTLNIKQPGLHKIELPSSIELEYDQIHLWQIGIPCSNNTARLSQVLRGAVKRVPLSEELAHQLSVTEEPLEKANIYANNGIWYDALNLAEQKLDSGAAVNYVQTLLQNVNINLDLEIISYQKSKY